MVVAVLLAAATRHAHSRPSRCFWTPALTSAFESYVDDLSNWYIRRSRRRFWNGEPEALATLWWSLVQAMRVVVHLAEECRSCDGGLRR